MKNFIKLIATLSVIILLTLDLPAQPPPPPNNGEPPGAGNTPVSDAPIGGGLLLLLGMGAGYGGIKFYNKRKRRIEE